MVKVGNLTFVPICGLFNLVIGPNPCMCLAASLCMYGLCGGMLLGLTFSMDSGVGKTIIWIMIGLNSLLFMCLCLSSPGIPSQIVSSAKGQPIFL